MTLAKANHALTPWYAKAGAACGIVPIARFIGPNVFALKTGGYGCLFSLTGIDEEGLTDQELESRVRTIEGALRGLPEGSCLYQYTRIMSGVELPRQTKYGNPVTDSFVTDRLTFLDKTASFRRIDLHWCLTFEPAKTTPFDRKPKDQGVDCSRLMANLQKTATILESHLAGGLGLRLLGKQEAFRFFSYLFNLEDWAHHDHLQGDLGVDRQIVKSTVAWHSDHLRVGKRHVQTFSLTNTPEASRPCLFSDLLSLDCDSILCSTWRPKSASAARKEIDQQEKFNEFFKVGVFARIMSGKNVASLDTTAGAKAANSNVDDLSEVIRSLDKKAQGEYSLRLLLAGKTAEQLRDTVPAVHRVFVDARAQVIEETLGNLSGFYAMFPGNHKFNVFPLWLGEDHHARLSSIFAPHLGNPHSEDLDSEYLNIFETRTRTPFYQDAYVNGVRVMLILGPTGTGKTTLITQILRQIQERGDSAIIYDPACEYIQRFYSEERGDIVLNPLDARCPYWGPAQEMRKNAEADAIAESLYAPTTDSKDEFFHQTPAQIFAHLLKQGPTPHQLAAWMANAPEIEARVKGTEMEHYIGQKAGPQRAGVLSSLGLVAKSLRLLPTMEQAGGRTWSANEWSEHRKGWIFITSRPTERGTLRPLHSLWIDLLVMRLLSKPRANQKPVWFVIDELASLQQLPKLHTAITENRKSQNPLVLGFQGKAQLEVIYGHLAEVMLSQPATKIFLRTTEPKAAEWVSKAIGNIEIERLKETKHDGARSGKNFTVDRQVEPLVMDSEIEGLADRHAYLKLGNNVARFSFLYMDMPQHTADFIPRVNEDDELGYDPKTLEPKNKPVPESAASATLLTPLPVEEPTAASVTAPVAAAPVTVAAPLSATTAPQQEIAPASIDQKEIEAQPQSLPTVEEAELTQEQEEQEEAEGKSFRLTSV